MKELFLAGWKMETSSSFKHPQHGELYHDNNLHCWMWQRPKGKPVRVGKMLLDAIPKLLKKTAQGVLV